MGYSHQKFCGICGRRPSLHGSISRNAASKVGRRGALAPEAIGSSMGPHWCALHQVIECRTDLLISHKVAWETWKWQEPAGDGLEYRRARRGRIGFPQRHEELKSRNAADFAFGTPMLPAARKERLSGHRRTAVGNATGIATAKLWWPPGAGSLGTACGE